VGHDHDHDDDKVVDVHLVVDEGLHVLALPYHRVAGCCRLRP
jgi:hypothetical protein